MNGLPRNFYNDDLKDLPLVDIDTDDNIDVEVNANEGGDMIENLNTANTHFDEEWMPQLPGDQQEQEDLIGQVGEAGLTSPQQPQYRLPYEQNICLTSQSSGSNDNERNAPRHRIEQPNPFQQTEQLQTREPQRMPNLQDIDGLSQLQGAENIAALNNRLQQQQLQQQYYPIPNNTIQTVNNYLGTTTQSLEPQMLSLQLQQQHQQLQQQQTSASNLQQSLVQLQKLQEQQQQILKNIGGVGLMDSNASLNQLSQWLIGHLGNNNGGSNNNNNTTNATIPGAGTWGQMQMPAIEQLQMNNNSLPNTVGTIPSLDPQIQPLQFGFVENIDLNQDSRQQQPQQHPQQTTLAECQQAPNKNNGSVEDQFRRFHDQNKNNIHDIPTIDPSPIIRKAEKKRESKAFPEQLWEAMMMEGSSNDNAFEWLPDGKSFVVVDSDLFCSGILDRKFKQSKYGSFVRKLHRWGFIRLTSGTGTDCFHHPMFQRHKPDLVTEIKCNNRNGKGGKEKGHNPYARGDILHNAQPSLMGVEKFIRAKVVSPDSAADITA